MSVVGKGWPPKRFTRRRRVSNKMWGGCRYYTNRAIEAVPRVVPITSRKRFDAFGNRGSDHFYLNVRADAVDRGISNSRVNAIWIARACGHPSPAHITDYGTWTTTRHGRRYQHQLIWSTHGSGPHLHYGVHRI